MNAKDKSLVGSINDAIKKQIEETWAAGKPIIVHRDGKTIECYPDGTEIVK